MNQLDSPGITLILLAAVQIFKDLFVSAYCFQTVLISGQDPLESHIVPDRPHSTLFITKNKQAERNIKLLYCV